MHLAFDIFQGIGVAAAVGIRPFLPALVASALAAGDVELSFKHTNFSFLQKPVFLLIMVLGVVLLGLFERRFSGSTAEPRWLTYGLAAVSLALGALFFGAELARRHDPVVIGIVAGVICAGVGVLATYPRRGHGPAVHHRSGRRDRRRVVDPGTANRRDPAAGAVVVAGRGPWPGAAEVRGSADPPVTRSRP